MTRSVVVTPLFVVRVVPIERSEPIEQSIQIRDRPGFILDRRHCRRRSHHANSRQSVHKLRIGDSPSHQRGHIVHIALARCLYLMLRVGNHWFEEESYCDAGRKMHVYGK